MAVQKKKCINSGTYSIIHMYEQCRFNVEILVTSRYGSVDLVFTALSCCVSFLFLFLLFALVNPSVRDIMLRVAFWGRYSK